MSENRRDRFRKFLTALSLAPPADADGATDVYVKRPDLAAAEQIAARLEIDPASSHLLVGGIGCGKTTQLYLIERRLRAVGDTRVTYLDVARHYDIQKLTPGVLFALAGLAIVVGIQNPQGPWPARSQNSRSGHTARRRRCLSPFRPLNGPADPGS